MTPGSPLEKDERRRRAMKAILGWFCDPYVHMLLVGLVLVRLAMGTGGDEPIASRDRMVRCQSCQSVHRIGKACLQVVAKTPDASPAN
jgi:hypothetical protein